MDSDKIQGAKTNAAAAALAVEELVTQLRTATTEIQIKPGFRPYRIDIDGDPVPVEALLLQPLQRRGFVQFYEALSFARFVNRYKNAQTVLFADIIARAFTAVLDFHPAGGLQSGASADLFRGTLPLKFTPSWEAWTAVNKKQMDQETFAQFLEDQIPDIAEPPAGKLVDIARTLEAKSEVSFESHIRAQNGAHRFAYSENIAGTAQGTLEIPHELTLALQPFEGSKLYEVKARFRYRIASKKLTMWFELVRLQDVLRAAFDDELLKIDSEINGVRGANAGVPIYNGPAPTAGA